MFQPVKANAEWQPQRILLYGTHGLGKTTFGATFEGAILLRTEDGASNVDIDTFPMVVKDSYDDEGRLARGSGYNTIINMVQWLLSESHQYKSLVIDSLDWTEPLIHSQTCAAKGQDSIESFGYGKGYIEADAPWLNLMNWLEHLLKVKQMNIILIAHSEIKNFAAPDTEPYDRYQIKLHKRAFALWQEWVDMVLFCRYRTVIERTETGFNQEKRRGTGTGERLIHTEERPAFLAKNRWGLPSEIYIGQDKTWGGFHTALNKATNGRYPMPATIKQENQDNV